MNCRFSLLLISSFLAAGCIQKLDDGLAAGGAAPGPAVECGGSQGYACPFPVITTTPRIATKADENGDPTETVDPTAAGACAKVIQDVMAPIDPVTLKGGILATKCAGCHQGGANAPGAPLLAILDQTKLNMVASPTPKFNGAFYVVPGNPAASLIYRRAVIDRDMPYQDSLQPPNFLTISESSVLNQWITSCVDGAPPSGDPNTGGTSAAGGMNTGGTGAGGTGAGGTGAGGTGAGGTGAGGTGGASGSAGSSSGGSAAMPMGGSGGGGSGGTGGAAAGGGAGGGGPPPCAGLCRNPINFTVTPPASFSATGFGMGAACYQTTSMLNGYNCGNDGGRTFSINGTMVACGASQAIPVPVRNGGYCFRATPAPTDLGAYFTAY